MPDVEWEAMQWGGWCNTERLVGSMGYISPAEAERWYLDRMEPIGKVV